MGLNLALSRMYGTVFMCLSNRESWFGGLCSDAFGTNKGCEYCALHFQTGNCNKARVKCLLTYARNPTECEV